MSPTMRRLATTVGILAVAAGARAVTSLAVFTDTASVGANSFTAGDIELTASPASAVVSFTNMLPGDQVTQSLTVSNAGTNQLRYAMTSQTSSGSDPFAAQLDLTIKTGVTTCDNANWTTDGTIIYGPGDLSTSAGINVIGDPTQGADAGDRTINSAANEVLCVNVTLPLSTNNTFEGLSAEATFTFEAEQTANNP